MPLVKVNRSEPNPKFMNLEKRLVGMEFDWYGKKMKNVLVKGTQTLYSTLYSQTYVNTYNLIQS